jgi:glycosyltransferase involved in cell wall biosynthesis
MKNSLVSIIIPVYNAETYLEQSIWSALEQTYENIEIIVVNDGSTDGSLSILEGIDNPRLEVHSQSNQGQSAALNAGIELAHGDYIKFFDADDILHPGHIESQLEVLGGRNDSVASCRWEYFQENIESVTFHEEVSYKDYDDPIQWIYDSLVKDQGMMGAWMWMIPKPVLDKAGRWDDRLSLNNDFDFSVRVLLASSSVKFARDARLYYRKGVQGALSGSQGRTAMESAYLTTKLGTESLLQREDSPRIRQLCADRFQQWLFKFYSQHPDLASKAEAYISSLGGSCVRMQGGLLLRALMPLIGWKAVRNLQNVLYRCGWQVVLGYKQQKRIKALR